jgi:hypothetical protein
MVMQFADLKARSHLTSTGSVKTFRFHKRVRLGKDWASTGRGKPKFADIHITFVKEIGDLLAELEPYVEESGFASVGEWVDRITKVNPVFSSSGFLYHVELIEVKK